MGRAAQPRGDGRGCGAERSRSPVDVFSPPPTGGRRNVPILPDPEVGGPTAGSMAEILAVDDVLGCSGPLSPSEFDLMAGKSTRNQQRGAACRLQSKHGVADL